MSPWLEGAAGLVGAVSVWSEWISASVILFPNAALIGQNRPLYHLAESLFCGMIAP